MVQMSRDKSYKLEAWERFWLRRLIHYVWRGRIISARVCVCVCQSSLVVNVSVSAPLLNQQQHFINKVTCRLDSLNLFECIHKILTLCVM